MRGFDANIFYYANKLRNWNRQQTMPMLAFSFALQCTFVDVLKKVNWTKSMKTIYLGILVCEIINDLFLRPWVSIVHGVMTRQC